MPLVAITRELGAGGTEIAGRVAAGLGVPLVHGEIAERVERTWGVPCLVISDFQSTAPPVLKSATSAAHRNFLYISSALLEVAATGSAVFRGWGAAQVLKPVAHAVTVRIGAPLKVRMERLCDRTDLGRLAARRMLEQHDGMRAWMAREYTGCDWRDPDEYDLSIDTGRTTLDEAAQQILELARSDTFRETGKSRESLENLKLEVLARATLQRDPGTRDLRLYIKATSEELVLGGIVRDGEQRERVIRALSPIAGGRSLTSRLRAPTDYRTRTSSI